MLIAFHKPTRGIYGFAHPGVPMDVNPRIAADCIRRGQAYEVKVIVPETKAAPAAPFRIVLGGDEEPSALAAVRAAVCAVPDLEAQGASPGVVGRKRGRPRKHPVSKAAPSRKS